MAWIAVFGLLLSIGCKQNRPGGGEDLAHFRVDGGSMAPTLFGEHARRRCGVCQLVWTVDVTAPIGNPLVRCRHCGEPLEPPDSGSAKCPAEIVSVTSAPSQAQGLSWLSIGDLIACRWNERLHLKRVVGLPGDEISTRAGRLYLNGRRIEDRLRDELAEQDISWTLVDCDDSRSESRWSNLDSGKNAEHRWRRSRTDSSAASRSPTNRSPENGSPAHTWQSPEVGDTWLVYHHVNVDRGNQPAFVGDDYPFNTTLSRALNQVDRIRVSADVESADGCELQVAFWTEDGGVAATLEVSGIASIRVASLEGEPAHDLPVDETRPLALRVTDGLAEVRSLSIERMIEYRLRPRDSNEYPVTLKANQCFVLGDNIPISVDSREIGPIDASQIVGRAKLPDPEERVPVVSRSIKNQER